jgi:hypothetical protein
LAHPEQVPARRYAAQHRPMLAFAGKSIRMNLLLPEHGIIHSLKNVTRQTAYSVTDKAKSNMKKDALAVLFCRICSI